MFDPISYSKISIIQNDNTTSTNTQEGWVDSFTNFLSVPQINNLPYKYINSSTQSIPLDIAEIDNELWIKVPQLFANETITIQVMDDGQGINNPDNVFEFFDDFETNDGWITDTLGTTYFGVDGTWLRVYDNDGTYHYAYRDIGLQPGCVVDYKWKIPSASQISAVNFYLQDSSFSDIYQTDVHMGGEGTGLSTNVEKIWYTTLGIVYPLSNNLVYKTGIRIAPDLTTTKTTYEIGNESNSVTITTTNTENLGPYWKFRVGVGNSYTCDYYVDYLLVRKYADLEPTVTLVSTTTDINGNTVYTYNITNPNNYDLYNYQIKLDGLTYNGIPTITNKIVSPTIYLPYYPAATNNLSNFITQFNHNCKIGSPVNFHAHIFIPEQTTTEQTIKLKFYYTILPPCGNISENSINGNSSPMIENSIEKIFTIPVGTYGHWELDFGTIFTYPDTVSVVVNCGLERLGLEDTFGDLLVAYCDFHYIADTLGSELEYMK